MNTSGRKNIFTYTLYVKKKITGLVIRVMLKYIHYKNTENFQGKRPNIKAIVKLTALNVSCLEFGITSSETELKV